MNADVTGPLNKILEDEYLDQSDEQILNHLREIEKQHIVVLTHSRMALDSFEAMIPDVNQVIRTGLPSVGLSISENKKTQVQITTENLTLYIDLIGKQHLKLKKENIQYYFGKI